MNPTLYYRVYGCGINKKAISRYAGYFKLCYLLYIIKDHVRGAEFKARSKGKAFIIKVD